MVSIQYCLFWKRAEGGGLEIGIREISTKCLAAETSCVAIEVHSTTYRHVVEERVSGGSVARLVLWNASDDSLLTK